MQPACFPKPIIPPRKRKRGRQEETANVRAWVKALNKLGVGFFWRVKNTGTYDPVRKCFRKDMSTDFVAIPDICGYLHNGKSVFIEAKYAADLDTKRKLIFAVKITDKQKEFLWNALQSECRAGIAFTLDDCIAIVRHDPTRYVRHPRTWAFIPPFIPDHEGKYAAIIKRYEEEKKALAKLRQDPVASATYLARTHDFDE